MGLHCPGRMHSFPGNGVRKPESRAILYRNIFMNSPWFENDRYEPVFYELCLPEMPGPFLYYLRGFDRWIAQADFFPIPGQPVLDCHLFVMRV